MSQRAAPHDYKGLQKAGFFVFVFFCGIPALEMNGFGFGIPFTPMSAFTCATVGGAVGGVLICLLSPSSSGGQGSRSIDA